MKSRIAKVLLFVCSLMLVFSGVHYVQAQSGVPGTLVQTSPTHQDSASVCLNSASSGGTLTFTPPGSQYFYLHEIDFQNGQSTTGVAAAAAPTQVTISNIAGSPIWNMASGAVTTPGTITQSFSVLYPTGLKSSVPGSSVVVTLPALITNQFLRVNACGYYAP